MTSEPIDPSSAAPTLDAAATDATDATAASIVTSRATSIEGTAMPVRKAVIPAAGLGTRFLPATKAQPKEMLPVVDTPSIQYVVEEAARSGLTDILIITGRGKRTIGDHFDRSFELEYFL